MRKLQVCSLYHHQHIKKLRRLQRSGNAFVARWATILWLSSLGHSVQEIAEGMGLHVQTVRERIRLFNAADRHTRWDRLRPPQRSGRPPTYALSVQQGLVDLLKQSPDKFRLDTAVWRLHDLLRIAKRTKLVKGATQKKFNVETVRRLLRQSGYVYLSTKWWITSDDPHYAHKKARRDRLLEAAKQDPSIIVVFQDESWFSGTPKAVRGYGRPDHPEDSAVEKLPHKIKGAWVLYAAYEALTGHVHRYYAPRCNQTQVRRQLETLLEHYQATGQRALIVIWDNASWHTAKALRRWYTRYNLKAKREGKIRMLIVRLPSRSPWLNPIEPVFGQAKRRIVGRRLVRQPSRLKQKTERYFNQREKQLERETAQTTAKT